MPKVARLEVETQCRLRGQIQRCSELGTAPSTGEVLFVVGVVIGMTVVGKQGRRK